jgi:hypothetical protein
LELLDAFVGDLHVAKPQEFEIRQGFQVNKPGIGVLPAHKDKDKDKVNANCIAKILVSMELS